MSDWKQFENGSIGSMSRVVDQKYVVKWWRTDAGDVDCSCTCLTASSTGWCDHLQHDADTEQIILHLIQDKDYFVKKGWTPGSARGKGRNGPL